MTKFLRLSQNDFHFAKQLLDVFGEAFEDTKRYNSKIIDEKYVQQILQNPLIIVLVAIEENTVIGGLVAYILQKLELNTNEIYLYDLAVMEQHRRKGIATNLIKKLQIIGEAENTKTIFVQADNIDKPAVSLYTKLATEVETEITHFDIETSSQN
jgi:aminoglycoside 3-N-acetyltransferase I